MDHEYISALISAAEYGAKGPVKIRIELCHSCYGLKFIGQYQPVGLAVRECQYLVGWDSFRAARYPIHMLHEVIDRVRAQLTDG